MKVKTKHTNKKTFGTLYKKSMALAGIEPGTKCCWDIYKWRGRIYFPTRLRRLVVKRGIGIKSRFLPVKSLGPSVTQAHLTNDLLTLVKLFKSSWMESFTSATEINGGSADWSP